MSARGARVAALASRLRAGVLAGLLAGASPLVAQEAPLARVTIERGGPGVATALLVEALKRPHRVLRSSAERPLVLARDSVYPTTLVIVGGPAAVSSRVSGDVIVVNGDLWIRPGAVVDGRAVAIGGGVYTSPLGFVKGEETDFPYQRFAMREDGGRVALRHEATTPEPPREPGIELPGYRGLRPWGYDRVDGLSLAWGPYLTIPVVGVELEPAVAWRSHRGALDPSLTVRVPFGGLADVTLDARRGTETNERWIVGDLPNGASSFVTGNDLRDYYRMERVRGVARTRVASGGFELEMRAGAQVEEAWSARATDDPQGPPWSVLNRTDVRRMSRPVPVVPRGRIRSALVAGRLTYERTGFRFDGDANVEHGRGDDRFTQVTLDGELAIPTRADQRLRFIGHVVATVDTAPRQRWTGVGGVGTLPTFRTLELTGDHVWFVDTRYEFPIERLTIPLVGTPNVAVRHLLGAAGVGRFTDVLQNWALRVDVGPVRTDVAVDPRSGGTALSLSLAVAR